MAWVGRICLPIVHRSINKVKIGWWTRRFQRKGPKGFYAGSKNLTVSVVFKFGCFHDSIGFPVRVYLSVPRYYRDNSRALHNARVGKNIRTVRMLKGFALKYVAGKLNMCISNLSNIENGLTSIEIDKIFRLAEILEVDYTILIDLNTAEILKKVRK